MGERQRRVRLSISQPSLPRDVVLTQLGCEPAEGNCNASQLQMAQAYRVQLQDAIQSYGSIWGSRDGYFLTACNQHEGASLAHRRVVGRLSVVTRPSYDHAHPATAHPRAETCQDFDWFGIRIAGATMNDTFSAWWSATAAGRVPDPTVSRRVDVAWPGDGTCQPWGVRHGGC